MINRSKQGWREVGGRRIFFRSTWEANYGRYLEFLKTHKEISSWEHEPDTFWFDDIKRGVRSYLPDFSVTNKNSQLEYHEVKGYMDSRSKTKIKRMRIYYPDIKLVIIDSTWFKKNSILSGIVPGWERGTRVSTQPKRKQNVR